MTDPAGVVSSTPAAGAAAVVTSGLAKDFGQRHAVAGIDLEVPTAAICGFVGPNGAGKTTTIRMLLGLIRPTAGTGTVLGEPLTHPARYLDRVGALIESPAFYPTLSGKANLVALARLGRIDRSRVDELLDRVGLLERGGDSYRSYSLGMKQRLGIAAALLPRPELLILDEPANGLDPAGILEVRQLLRSLADEGLTVFVSSHLLAEVEQICDHLVMIQSGQLLFQGHVSELLAAQSGQLLARPERADQLEALAGLIRAEGRTVLAYGDMLSVATDATWAADLNRLAMNAGITLVHLSEHRPTLEEAFFHMVGTETGDVHGRLTKVESK